MKSLTERVEKPEIPDVEQWGPYLRSVYLEFGFGSQYAEVLREAQSLFWRQHGQFGRLGRWAMDGVDPGAPTCRCSECWS